MAVELTRMDFHVSRFMSSEDVEEMDASEVGQFCLLMFKAWLIGKDCTLPVEEEKLARYARVTSVSNLVLSKFPITDTECGPRRRNDVQYGVWLDARARSEAGKAGAANRWGKQWDGNSKDDATALPSQSGRNAVAVLTALPNPTQPVPEQTISIQSNVCDQGAEVQEVKIQTLGDWKTLRIRHKRVFGIQAATVHREKYAQACHEYGEDVVLTCFDDWAQDAKDWVESAGVRQPLFAFWKKLSEMADTVAGVKDEVQAEEVKAAVAGEEERRRQKIIEENVKRQAQLNVAFMESEPARPENECTIDDLEAN